MLKWLDKRQAAVFFAFCILFATQAPYARSESGVSFEIANVETSLSDNSLLYTITGSSAPVYTVSERFSPFRVIVDIAGALYADTVTPEAAHVPHNDFTSLNILNLKEKSPQVMRFEFLLTDSHDYSVDQTGNSIQIKLFPAPGENKTASSSKSMSGVRALTDFKVTSTPNSTTIALVSSGSIENYTVDTIGSGANKPPRMFIDIDDVNISELIREKHIGTSLEKIRVAPRANGARIVFDSANQELFKYTVVPSADGLNVVIDESAIGVAAKPSGQSKQPDSSPGSDKILDQLIGSSEQLLSQDPEKIAAGTASSKAATLASDFSFSGYKKQNISVDFYKIDIHNVFRLFRQISELNIIVDEEVQGLLTLALTDVPWDFALDIILNLMDLKKEERFNTIVIYPGKKEFVWPTRAEDNLAFEADVEIIEEESLIIEQSASLSKEIVQAKALMMQAQGYEKNGEFEDAAVLYTQALALWPDNSNILTRLATIHLVNLGMNAKAVFYAQQNLKLDPTNSHAALYAAIGSANMNRISEASDYFAQSISDTPPIKEALISYASFSENNGQNDAALKLINKYQTYYGETVDTMIAKARLLDKLGRTEDATQQYYALLTSGFRLRPDLQEYINGRVTNQNLN